MVLGGGTGEQGEHDRVSAGEEVELISGKGGGGGIRRPVGDCVTKRDGEGLSVFVALKHQQFHFPLFAWY